MSFSHGDIIIPTFVNNQNYSPKNSAIYLCLNDHQEHHQGYDQRTAIMLYGFREPLVETLVSSLPQASHRKQVYDTLTRYYLHEEEYRRSNYIHLGDEDSGGHLLVHLTSYIVSMDRNFRKINNKAELMHYFRKNCEEHIHPFTNRSFIESKFQTFIEETKHLPFFQFTSDFKDLSNLSAPF